MNIIIRFDRISECHFIKALRNLEMKEIQIGDKW